MKKIKTVFAIDRNTNRVTTEVVAHWVIAGEGVATVKWDGTSCAVIGGALFKRYDAKPGRVPPAGFTPCEPAPDANTGHWPGWVPVSDSDSADRAHREAFGSGGLADGTYELLGPKVQKNPYGLAHHELRLHGAHAVDVPRTFEGIRKWLSENEGEGLVFHHEDGRMAKIRRKDFGISWNR